MVGDLGYDFDRGLTTLDAMVKAMSSAPENSSLLLLGDITGPEGLRKKNSPEREHLLAILQRLKQVAGPVYYTPGENELGQQSKFSRLKRLEKFLKEEGGDKVRMMPNNECSGPDDEELFDRVGLIGINTAWFLADWSLDKEVSEGCDYTNRDAMLFALADEIKGYRGQVKIVMMHHPMQSNGNRGGQYSLRQHLFPLADVIPGAYLPLPVVGSVIRGIQGVSGGPNDVGNLLYQDMVRSIKSGIDDEINVIFVSGHEHNLMLAHEKEYVNITAGSGSVRSPARGGNDANFAYGEVGYSRLDFFDSGEVHVGFYTVDENGQEQKVFYRRIIEDRHLPSDDGIEAVDIEVVNDDTVKAVVYKLGAKDKSGLIKAALGEHYRPLYYVPVAVPVLNIDTLFGGLEPYRRGGGMTTMSLHSKAANGRYYQLRSVRKNPSQLLPSLLEQSFAADLARDQFTSIHPFAPLTLPPMQRRLGLLGADPKLYYIPKQPGLGDFNTNFGGEMYWLEQRPDEDWSGTDFFGGSKDIISNSKVREEITYDWKHYADYKNYARARLFDMFIGDWDRHRDQWRWSSFEEEDGRTRYVPVARDRDQVYSNYDGGLLTVARVFLAEARKLRPFDGKLDRVKWRAMNGKWNDRVFLNEITKEEMLVEARTIQATLTDEAIDEAMELFPEEVKDYSLGKEQIGEKLKQRRNQLETLANEYYAILAEKVDILGTDKNDIIHATGLENGDLHVEVYDASKEGEVDEKYYGRIFHVGETKEVVVYGLDGKDRFRTQGPPSSIRLRLVGGNDKDEIVADGQLRAMAYDEKEGMKFSGNTSTIVDRRSDRFPELNQYDFEEYYPDYTTPTPAFGFNVDDGLFFGLGFSRTNHGFRSDPYKTRHAALATYSSNEFFKFSYTGTYNDFFSRQTDLVLDAHYYTPGYVANFFGLGNEGPGQPEEGEIEGVGEEEELEYNRARRQEIMVRPTLRFRGKRNRTVFSLAPFYHAFDLDDDTPDYALILNTPGIPARVFENQPFGGLLAHLESNNVAIPLLADNGVKYDLFAQQSWNLKDEGRSTLKYGGNLTVYRMLTKVINVATRIGFEHNDGQPEYYQLASMGGRTNYRAARADRYRGNTLFYQNIDLRFMGFNFGKGEAPTVGGFIFGLDYGRVWLKGEDSEKWHVGYGGGVWLAPLGATIVSLTYFRDSEQSRVAFAAGWPF